MKQPSDSSDKHIPPEPASASFPCDYELRVAGRISGHGASWFAGMALTVDEQTDPSQTIIRGQIVDQAALYGLISRVRDLGLTLLAVARVEPGEEDVTDENDSREAK